MTSDIYLYIYLRIYLQKRFGGNRETVGGKGAATEAAGGVRLNWNSHYSIIHLGRSEATRKVPLGRGPAIQDKSNILCISCRITRVVWHALKSPRKRGKSTR